MFDCTSWRERSNCWELITYELTCEECGHLFFAERPKFWLYRAEADGYSKKWTGVCSKCEPLRETRELAFRERTKPRREEKAAGEAPDLEMPKVSEEVQQQLGLKDRDEYWK